MFSCMITIARIDKLNLNPKVHTYRNTVCLLKLREITDPSVWINIIARINAARYVHAQSRFTADLSSLSTDLHRMQHRINLVASALLILRKFTRNSTRPSRFVHAIRATFCRECDYCLEFTRIEPMLPGTRQMFRPLTERPRIYALPPLPRPITPSSRTNATHGSSRYHEKTFRSSIEI